MSLLFFRQFGHIGSVLTLLLLSSAHGLLEWVKKPENRSVVFGQDLVLSCQARWANQSDMSTSVAYQWRHNGTSLPDKASRFFNNSLFVPNVSPLDLGIYTCVASRADENGNVDSLNSSSVVIKAYIEPFIFHPQSVDAGIGERVVLTCVTGKGSPSLEVQWLRNGNLFLQGDQMTMTYGDFDATGLSTQVSSKLTVIMTGNLYGMYGCMATNKFLNSSVMSSPANVSYKITPGAALPIIEWNYPESLVVSDGHDLILSCRTQESSEFIQVSWYVDQNQMSSSPRIYTLSNNSLEFSPFLDKDGGNYSCLAVNSVGQTMSPSVRVTAAYLDLHFISEPSDTSAFLGDDVVLRCEPPDSDPPALVTWYKDYSPLNLTSDGVKVVGHDLHLMSVGLSERGQYFCVAFNGLSLPSSRTSALAVLRVQGPPIMTVPPINTKIVKGRLLNLTCSVDGEPSANNSWFFEGRPIAMDAKIAVVKRGQELWISDVGKEWEGRFTCLAANLYGTASADAYVTVTAPPTSLQPIGNLVVRAGNPLSIHCYVVSDPMPVIQWYFNGSKLSLSNYTGSSLAMTLTQVNSDLLIGNVTVNHAGNYLCVGSNEAGNATSSGSVSVNVEPTIAETSKNLTPVIGQSVSLSCHSQGQPTPSVHWLHNLSLTLPQNSVLDDHNTSLTIVNLTWASSGQYTCVAQNSVGTAQTSTYISLQVPPRIDATSSPQSPVKIYTKYVLSCSASGIPTPDLQWTHLNQIVKPSPDGRIQCPEVGELVVQFALKNDSGLYECWASSSAGLEKTVVSVVVYGPPSPPVLVSAVPLSSASVYLTWQWLDNGDQAEIVDQFQVSYREKTSADFVVGPIKYMRNITRLEVIDLNPGTEYVFYVSAINDAGVSIPSNYLSAVTHQSGPSVPVNLKVKNVNSTAATLTWEQPTTPNGVVRLYQLVYTKVNGLISDLVAININSPNFPTQELLLSPLRPYTQYNGQVRAANIEDSQQLWGSYSPMITFQTAASKPTLPPQFVQLNAVDPYSVKVTWQQIPVFAQNGPILFYNISYHNNESQLNANVRVDNSVTEYTINGLFPWRLYTVQMYAVNAAGNGPDSDPSGIWTLPIAPVTPPTDLKATANSATSLILSWKALQSSLLTCNVTSYRIQFRVLGSAVWQEKQTLSNSSTLLSYTLDLLQPWTWYECQVAAFTETVNPGQGPFTYPVYIRTLQGVSGPVNALFYSAALTTVTISWQPPADVKGVLIGYQVSFNSTKNANVSKDGLRLLDKAVTFVTLEYLDPDVTYSISIAAMNEAGKGEEVILRVRTLADFSIETVEPTNTAFIQTSDVSNSTRYALQQQGGNSVKQNLAAIVAGSIVGTIALVIFTIFVCLQCIKYRRKLRMNYVINTDTENADPVNAYRPLESALSTPFTPSVVVTDYSSIKSPHVTESQSAPAILTIQSSNHGTFSDSVAVSSSSSSKNYNNNNNQEKSEQKVLGASKILTIPKISVSNAYTKLEDEVYASAAQADTRGIENLGFVPVALREERKSYSYLDVPRLSIISDDTISVTSDTLKRRNRMRSDSAAAIAVLKTSQSMMSSADTDILVENEIDSEVIFNERTVL